MEQGVKLVGFALPLGVSMQERETESRNTIWKGKAATTIQIVDFSDRSVQTALCGLNGERMCLHHDSLPLHLKNGDEIAEKFGSRVREASSRSINHQTLAKCRDDVAQHNFESLEAVVGLFEVKIIRYFQRC